MTRFRFISQGMQFLCFVGVAGLILSMACSCADEFPTPIDTEKSTAQPMSPEQVVETATIPEGFRLSVFAAEPHVQNPIAITTDERGRLWVAENYTWAGSLLGNYRTDLSDRVVILEDTDGDGRHDKRSVFWDGAKKLTSVEVGFGGVWVLALPHLLFIPDRDRNDVPDGPPEIILDGFNESSVGHTPANGLRWGPDGWLYARHGILATSSIGVPGASDSQRVQINTGVWRYHPITRTVEAVMHGMTNSWGFDYNAAGEMFCINTVIGHLWHVLPGARTERMFGADLNPRAYQLMPQVADHVHWDTGEVWHAVRNGISDSTLAAGGGHAHIGLMIYQGDNWPSEYRDHVYTLNLHGRRINCDSLERNGAGYVAHHKPDLAVFADPFFRGMDLITGPDGGVFIADWSDTGECHDHDGVHRTSGRIYKLTYGTPTPLAAFDLATQSTQSLINLQDHPNAWFGRHARRLLQEQNGADNKLRDFSASPKGQASNTHPFLDLHQAWAEFAIGKMAPAELLKSTSEACRVWGVRLASDPCTPSATTLSPASVSLFEQMAKEDTSGIVLLHLASALQRLPDAQRWPVAEQLVRRGEFASDKFYPIMVWLGIESILVADTQRAHTLAAKSELPLITRNIARRLGETIDTQMPSVEALIQLSHESLSQREQTGRAVDIVVGLAHALAGWSKAPIPKNWTTLAAKLPVADNAELQQAVDGLNIVFGDGQAIDRLQAIATDGKADSAVRRQAILAVSRGKTIGFDKLLLDLLGDRAVHEAALQGLLNYNLPETPQRALAQLGAYGPEARVELVRLLVSRPAYASQLLSAVSEGKILADEISAYHARQIHSFEDPVLIESLTKLWGDIRPTSEGKVVTMTKLRDSLRQEKLADAKPIHGRALFNKVCANCHVLYGQGRRIGPDLTGANRQNLDYLLENIVDPSASVGNDFRATIFILDDGRVLSGVVTAQNERTISIQTPEGVLTIDRETINESRVTSTSLMPEALLQNLSESDVQDLFAYVMSTSQVPLTVE